MRGGGGALSRHPGVCLVGNPRRHGRGGRSAVNVGARGKRISRGAPCAVSGPCQPAGSRTKIDRLCDLQAEYPFPAPFGYYPTVLHPWRWCDPASSGCARAAAANAGALSTAPSSSPRRAHTSATAWGASRTATMRLRRQPFPRPRKRGRLPVSPGRRPARAPLCPGLVSVGCVVD